MRLNDLLSRFTILPLKDHRCFGPRIAALDPIDFTNYSCSMKVDTIELEFELDESRMEGKGTCVRAIREVLQQRSNQSLYVNSLSGSINSTTRFVVTVQDPTYEQLTDIYQAIAERYPCNSHPSIGSIDIAFDMKPHDVTDVNKALSDAIVFMRRSLLPRIDWETTKKGLALPRIYSPKFNCKKTRHLRTFNQPGQFKMSEHAEEIFYIGDRKSAISYKVYWKKGDKRNPATDSEGIPFALSEQFARLEVCIRGEAITEHLGYKKLDEMSSPRFSGVLKLLRFVAPIVSEPEPDDSNMLRSLKAKQAELILDKEYTERGMWETTVLNRTTKERASVKGRTVVHTGAQGALKNARKRMLRQFFGNQLQDPKH